MPPHSRSARLYPPFLYSPRYTSHHWMGNFQKGNGGGGTSFSSSLSKAIRLACPYAEYIKKKRAKYSTRKRWEHIFTYEKREGGWIRGVHPPRVEGRDRALFTKRNSIPKFSVAVVISFNRINFKQLSVYIDSGNWKKRNWKLQHQIAGLKVEGKRNVNFVE